MTVVYVSGPMTGLPEHNFPAFRTAAAALWAAGFEVLDPSVFGEHVGWSWADYLRRDLPDVLRADVLALLPGWQDSRGARLEVHVARELGTPQLSVETVLTRGPQAFAPQQETRS